LNSRAIRYSQYLPCRGKESAMSQPSIGINIGRRQLVTGAVACVFTSLAAGTSIAQPAATPAAQSAVWPAKLIAAARAQVGVTLRYDPAYTRLAFPGGDVPREKGVCTDVVVRAYRDALGIDLQALVNADMKAAFSNYPTRWGLNRPDASIDHRRVLNLRVFFQRKGFAVGPARLTPDVFEPGDLATQTLPGNLPHIGVVSDKSAASGRLLLIHNIGAGTEESDVLATYTLTGRYRLTPA
jgi:uncharacterized protein